MGEDDIDSAAEKFSLPVHAVIDANQASHGMRHDDYKQYHAYCTRRLSRLRHAQSVRRDLVHSAAYVSGEKKKRNAYCPREQKTNSENGSLCWEPNGHGLIRVNSRLSRRRASRL